MNSVLRANCGSSPFLAWGDFHHQGHKGHKGNSFRCARFLINALRASARETEVYFLRPLSFRFRSASFIFYLSAFIFSFAPSALKTVSPVGGIVRKCDLLRKRLRLSVFHFRASGASTLSAAEIFSRRVTRRFFNPL
jgi:hypothetical protein